MDRPRWDGIQALFHEATELPPAARRQFLELRCPGDPELVSEVLALLDEDARTTLLDRGVAPLAGDLIGAIEPLAIDSGQFHPYRLKTLLGEGGMGVVYLAERPDRRTRCFIRDHAVVDRNERQSHHRHRRTRPSCPRCPTLFGSAK